MTNKEKFIERNLKHGCDKEFAKNLPIYEIKKDYFEYEIDNDDIFMQFISFDREDLNKLRIVCFLINLKTEKYDYEYAILNLLNILKERMTFSGRKEAYSPLSDTFIELGYSGLITEYGKKIGMEIIFRTDTGNYKVEVKW